MKIKLIAAIGTEHQIGKDNELLWDSKRDLEMFKKETTGKTILMGRKTFDSLPGVLPERNHVVVSRKDFVAPEGVRKFNDLEDALRQLKNEELEELYIIGGAEIYHQTMGIADELIISHFPFQGEADSFFPPFSRKVWRAVQTLSFSPAMNEPMSFKFVRYRRKNQWWKNQVFKKRQKKMYL